MDHDMEEIPAQDNLDLEDQTQPEVDNSPKEVLVEVPAPPKAVKVAKKHHFFTAKCQENKYISLEQMLYVFQISLGPPWV